MNRLITAAVFMIAAISLPAAAQRGGRGFHGMGVAPAARFNSGVVVSRRIPSNSVFIHGGVTFGHPRARVFVGPGCCRRFFRPRFRSTFFPFFYGYLPYDYPFYPEYPAAVEPAPPVYYPANTAAPSSYDEGRLEQKLDDLQSEVEQLRAESMRNSQGQAAPPKPEPAPATILIFRDGRREEVQNYAIVGDTLWIFNERRARKFPLVDLDRAATRKANADLGIDFSVPNNR